MGLDFDALDYCRTLIRKPGPYRCPVEKCGKSYKSIYGLQYHLVNYDHNNPQPLTPLITPHRKKGRNRAAMQQKMPSPENGPKEAFTYHEAQKLVQFDIDGKSIKVPTEEPITMITLDEWTKLLESGEGAPFLPLPSEPHIIKLPEASVKLREDYEINDALPRPNAYIRFIEKSAEELDGEVEYDCDEEDKIWLTIINDRRTAQNLSAIGLDTLELLIDRLEKESYFQAIANGQSGVAVDDDAVCCICLDGECQNTNVILFCDMCNLAVHQDCYGVPYIPEGQWLCRRCLQSPSRPVDCVLCPNTGGAFKQTDRGQWAHVVCALWIPEVRFANTVFLEPIDSIETIPAARWRLTCYICKQKGVGACIQCQKNSCYAGFHVTCAQQAGLHMRMDTVNDNGQTSQPIIVQKTAFCDAHCPTGSADNSCTESEQARQKSRIKMKQARKMLAKKRTCLPTILVPTIPPDRLQEIGSLVHVQKKAQFLQRLIAYWTLKRQYRNGVPLLRRLQSQGQTHQGSRGIEGSPNASELYQQLKYWQCLRQDLERARLLCELVRKREKLKAAYIRVKEKCVLMELNPIEAAMHKLFDLLKQKDTTDIFGEPVDVNEVPDYMDVVTHPMDLSTMARKLQAGLYITLNDMENDFNLMIKNCLAYNNKDTIFYRAGIRMRDHGSTLFKAARKELEKDGLVESQPSDDNLAHEIDYEFSELLRMQASEELIVRLNALLEKATRLKHGLARAKRNKNIRLEITKIKKILNKEQINANTDSSQSDMDVKKSSNEIVQQSAAKEATAAEGETTQVSAAASTAVMTPESPFKNSMNVSTSPSGVNRRTAVLFTRKAQAALKKPETPIKEELSSVQESIDKTKPSKKVGRSKRYVNRKSVETTTTSPNNLDKKKPTTSGDNHFNKMIGKAARFDVMPDSFRIYRAQENRDLSDSDKSHVSFTDSTCSSCSGFSDSGTGSDFGSSFEDDIDAATCSDSEMMSSEAEVNPKAATKATFEPLQLVWAKCLGYPWYPALIIDPDIPKGFIYNGVPLPAPPTDVLALRKDKTEPVFLVLFFDAKRTWQWLPPNKLELLGLNQMVDESKLTESRKPTDRKSVKKAYIDAKHYQSQVSDLDAQGPGEIM